MIQIYDSLSRQKEPLPEQKKLRLFVCGPTVYDYSHIGHARTYIFFDFFAKYLQSRGYEVNYLQNITNIDDKIIRRAAEENKDPLKLAAEFTDAYFNDMAVLGVDAVTHYAPATDFIPQIAAQTERLIEKGFAYKIDGDGWYFDIAKDPDYGKLSGRTVEQAEDSVSRIDESVSKRNKGDFALWKFSKPGEPSWNTRLGAGRPGWHIEDTAITEYYFGPGYDIHGGGADLKFPHHEAEMAQQISASGIKPEEFVKIWMHTGALLVDGKKMSKSLRNFITIRDFLKKYPPEILRLLVLKHHYRSPMDYTDGLAEEAKTNLQDIGMFVRKLKKMLNGIESRQLPMAPASDGSILDALEDDLNTPKAFADLYSFISSHQKDVWNLDAPVARTYAQTIEHFFELFSIALPNPQIPEKIEKMAEEMEQFRTNKQFAQSDALRKEIEGLGYMIENTPRGPFLWPK
ncbi:MAG: cysteine--tRNA ligase [Patescibacteria group bacterium]|nr:cysteine--tRNA ligase [Patescibacteria group bacterium]